MGYPPGEPVPRLEAWVPRIRRPQVKDYRESPDLTILFNTERMAANNPLLALSSYGSWCWGEIGKGASVRRMQEESLRAFGGDEVVSFLNRLAGLGFIEPLPEGFLPSREPERMVKEIPAPEAQHGLAQAKIPWYLLWEITRVCDLRCRLCYLPDHTDAGPPYEEAVRIAAELSDSGVFYVAFMGGEPLLYPGLTSLIHFLRERGIFVKVITNGMTLTPARAAELSAAGLNQVEVSLDGLTPATHELSRGARSLTAALAAIEHGQKAGIPRVGVTWTVHSRNVHELPDLPAFMRRHGLRECYLSPFRKTGLEGGRAPVDALQASDSNETLTRLAKWKETEPDLIISLGSHPSCSCGRTSAVLGADGGVRICPFDPAPASNIRDHSFLSIWRSLRERLPAAGAAGFCRAG